MSRTDWSHLLDPSAMASTEVPDDEETFLDALEGELRMAARYRNATGELVAMQAAGLITIEQRNAASAVLTAEGQPHVAAALGLVEQRGRARTGRPRSNGQVPAPSTATGAKA